MLGLRLDTIVFEACKKLDGLQKEMDAEFESIRRHTDSATIKPLYDWIKFDGLFVPDFSHSFDQKKVFSEFFFYGYCRIVDDYQVWEHNPSLQLSRLDQLANNIKIDPDFKVIKKLTGTVQKAH
jgi:hypothetical protein